MAHIELSLNDESSPLKEFTTSTTVNGGRTATFRLEPPMTIKPGDGVTLRHDTMAWSGIVSDVTVSSTSTWGTATSGMWTGTFTLHSSHFRYGDMVRYRSDGGCYMVLRDHGEMVDVICLSPPPTSRGKWSAGETDQISSDSFEPIPEEDE